MEEKLSSIKDEILEERAIIIATEKLVNMRQIMSAEGNSSFEKSPLRTLILSDKLN